MMQTPRRTSQFRALLADPDPTYLLEAHNGLTARIVEEAGFPAIWASGLTISASLGVRDCNELSWTQVLDVLEYMSDATALPILVDADTGYGNFNNVRRLVRKLEQRGIAAVCIEDKLFPKTNSFIGERQPLADVDEFAGRIRAAKDTQTDEDFTVVARVEALISGWSMDEALLRAHAYDDAGADAILIHSKRSTAHQVLEFASRWDSDTPIVVVPTTYPDTSPTAFAEAGISIVIWANHLLRTGIAAMQEAARSLRTASGPVGLSAPIVPVGEIFRLQKVEELLAAEAVYLPTTAVTSVADDASRPMAAKG